MNSSLRLCKFSPLRTPDVVAAKDKAFKLKRGKRPAASDVLSDVESLASVTTRDIRAIARSVQEKMARRNNLESSDEDLFITQAFKKPGKAQPSGLAGERGNISSVKQNGKKLAPPPTPDSDSDSSSLLTDSSDSESDQPELVKKSSVSKKNTDGKSPTSHKPRVDAQKAEQKRNVVAKPADKKQTKEKCVADKKEKLVKLNDRTRKKRKSKELSDDDDDDDDDSDTQSDIIPVTSPLKVYSGKKSAQHRAVQMKEKTDTGVDLSKKNRIHDKKEDMEVSESISELFGHSNTSLESVAATVKKEGKKAINIASSVSISSDSELMSETDEENSAEVQSADTKNKKNKKPSPIKKVETTFTKIKTSKKGSSNRRNSSEEHNLSNLGQTKLDKYLVKVAKSKSSVHESNDSVISIEGDENVTAEEVMESDGKEKTTKRHNSRKQPMTSSGKKKRSSSGSSSSDSYETSKNADIANDSDASSEILTDDESLQSKTSTFSKGSPGKTSKSNDARAKHSISSSDSSDVENVVKESTSKVSQKGKVPETSTSESDDSDDDIIKGTQDRTPGLKSIMSFKRKSPSNVSNISQNKKRESISSNSSDETFASPPATNNVNNKSRDSESSSSSSESEDSVEENVNSNVRDKQRSNVGSQGYKREHNASSSSSSDNDENESRKMKTGKQTVRDKDVESSKSESGSDDDDKSNDDASTGDDSEESHAKAKTSAQSKRRKHSVSSSSSSDDEKGNSSQSKRRKHSVSSSSSSDSDKGNTSQSKRRKHSISSSDSSDEETETVKKKTKVTKAPVSSEDSDDSEHSSESDDEDEVDGEDKVAGKSAAKAGRDSRRRTDSISSDSSSDEDSDERQLAKTPVKAAASQDKAKDLGFPTPRNFEVKTTDDIVDRSSLKGKKIFLLSTPPDFDISLLDGQSVSMSGEQSIISGKKSNKSYEVSCLQAAKKQTTSLCTVATDNVKGEDSLVIGPEVRGQMLVMNWVPAIPPVVLNKPQLARHTVPSDLKPHFTPFGSRSPPRLPKSEDTPKSHKKSKAKKRHKESMEVETVTPSKKGKLYGKPATEAGESKAHDGETVTTEKKKSEKKKKKKHKKEKD